jgi:hypothetical protein
MTTLPGVQAAPVLIAGVSALDVPMLAVRNPARTGEVVGEVALEHALDSCCEIQTLAHRSDVIPIAPAR